MEINTLHEIYRTTTSINLLFIAATITVFVFAITLLGHAIELAERKRKKIKEDEEESFTLEIEKLKEDIKKASVSEDLEAMRRRLAKYKEGKERVGKELEKIDRESYMLGVKESVFYPVIFFFVSIISTKLAEISSFMLLWLLALIFMIIGAFRFFRCLMLIEEISLESKKISKETQLELIEKILLKTKKVEEKTKKEIVGLIKSIETEREELKRPQLELIFKDTLPLIFKKSSDVVINFSLHLINGDVAPSSDVMFFIPSNFQVKGSDTWKQPPSKTTFANFTTTSISWEEDLKAGRLYPASIKLRTPDQKDEFEFGYRIYCIGYDSGYKKFQVKIEE